MKDFEKNLQKLAKEIRNSMEANEKLKEILEKFLSENFEITISRFSIKKPSDKKVPEENKSLIIISPQKDMVLEVKKSIRKNLNLTPEDHLFLKSIKIKSDE